jgi:hypothetical protein
MQVSEKGSATRKPPRRLKLGKAKRERKRERERESLVHQLAYIIPAKGVSLFLLRGHGSLHTSKIAADPPSVHGHPV